MRAKELQIRYKTKHAGTDFKVAVVVSKKTSKQAVVRNKIRRRIYEWIRLNLPKDYKYDIMVTVFAHELAAVPSEQISKLLESNFEKIKQKQEIHKT